LGTGAGRALVAGVLLKVIAFATDLLPRPFSLAHDLIDTAGDVLVLGAVVVALVRLFRVLRVRLLWRVRRKLILSYIFIGVVPALLIITFFLLSGLLMFYNVSAYLMQARMNALAQEARLLAQSAAFELEASRSLAESRGVLSRRQQAAVREYPGVSFAMVPPPARCGAATPGAATLTAGDWTHLEAPTGVPAWVPCEGFAGLIAYNEPVGAGGAAARRTRLVARALARSDSSNAASAVIVDLPVGDRLAQRLQEDSGIALGTVTPLNRTGSNVTPIEPQSSDDPNARPRILLPTGGIGLPAAANASGGGGLLRRPLEWVSLLDYTDWTSGELGAVAVAIRMSIADLYTRVSASPIERIGNLSFGQLLLLGLALVGVSFLVIQSVALAMGMTLAKSITGSVHELFAGTERVRRGDFTHKIAIRSRDQLGELAESFNSMTASIEDLLQQKAEKERLAQELRIARQIQMSLSRCRCCRAGR
jgi:phosphoserine phosphatase RsbU/P